MLSSHSITLAGSNLLFVAISAALVLQPGLEIVLYPAYALVFLWGDLRRDEETHVIFLFLITVAAALICVRGAPAPLRIALAAQASGIWLLSFGLGAHRSRMAGERYRALSAGESLDTRFRDAQRELRLYDAYGQSAVAQIILRRDLTSAAKTLSSTMDPDETQLRLVRILEGRYQGSRVRVIPGAPSDPVIDWAVRSRSPVLVKDSRRDERFSFSGAAPFRSAMVVGMRVMQSSYGFVRLESDKEQAYAQEDLRTVDLFATLASLTLENIQMYHEVHDLAIHDHLTQLHTQRAFRQRLKEELLRAGRGHSPVSLILGDIDFFKQYNDTYGHQAGDELLRSVARLLLAGTRAVDCVARYGGEEFAVILPNVEKDQARALAEHIRAALAAEPFPFQGRRTQVTMSFGVSAFPEDATTQNQLLRTADERLYQSKAEGRNRVS